MDASGIAFRIRSAILFIPSSAKTGVSSFSNLFDASVLKLSRVDVFLTETGSKFADSTIIRFVLNVTSARLPPFVPAIASGPSSSAITRSSDESSIFSPVSKMISSFGFAFLTSIVPFTRSASKTCMGWPISSITKFAKSTRLLMLFCPTDSSRSLSHFGDSPTETPLIPSAMYLLHKSPAAIFTFTENPPPLLNPDLSSWIFLFAPEIVSISRAIPLWHKR